MSASTHEVVNQSSPLADINLFDSDPALLTHAAVQGASESFADLSRLGATLGEARVLELGRLANEHPPRLKTHDRFGRRIDEVEFHPAWHELMSRLIGEATHCSPWLAPGAGSQVARAARYLMFAQVENGSQCPVTMTYAAAPVLARAPALADWHAKLLSRHYDPRPLPLADKLGITVGMGMTEKQGGSDVRANTTNAEFAGVNEWGSEYRLTGHKWFMSAPMCDAFLVLARTGDDSPASLSCFLLPRRLPDGSLNALQIQRLKDKLGNRSNASSEVEFRGASAWLVGEVGRGIPTILEMASLTRLDCALGSAGVMRAASAQALHHARERRAFGRRLVDQPLMQQVLADLALETEAAVALALRLARTLDGIADPFERVLSRLGTPIAKYWVCKRGPALAAEAMEVLGGNGYAEEAPLARLYRELPVNSIWEGSGNVMCLDVLRALSREPHAREALLAELALARGADTRYDRRLAELTQALGRPLEEATARHLVGRLALQWQAALLLQHSPSAVADMFCASRLGDDPMAGFAFGALPSGCDAGAVAARVLA